MLSIAFTVRSVDAGFADALRWHLAPFHRSSAGADPYSVDLYVQEEDEGRDPAPFSYFTAGIRRAQNEMLADLLAFAVWDAHGAVPKVARDFLFLHAGAVTRDGGALLLPAPMDSGKSSLTLALLQQGFDYLSDEYGCLDPITGRAYPLEKRIALEQDSLRLFPGLEGRLQDRLAPQIHLSKRFVRPEDIDARIGVPANVRWLVFPTTVWDGAPRLIPLTSAAAVEEMAASSFNLDRYHDRGVILLSRIAKSASAFRLEGGSPAERADLLAERLT